MHLHARTVLMALFSLIAFPTLGKVSSGPETTLKKEAARIQKDCHADLQKLCSDVTPGEGRIAACLNSRENKLSPACHATWTNAKARISRRIDEHEVAFRKDCGEDVKKYCSDVPSGRGRLLDCLDHNSDQLSNSCQQFRASIEERLDSLVG